MGKVAEITPANLGKLNSSRRGLKRSSTKLGDKMVEKQPVVKIYTTPTCPYCAMAKAFLGENGIDFVEINVASDRAAAIEMIEKSGQMGVPVFDIGGEIIVGFDREAIRRALKLS